VSALKGKSVLITGGARRIGREIALAFAAAGADVAITYLHSQEDAHQTLRDIESHGKKALCLFCDVREPLSVQKTVSEVAEGFGGLDVLVNNAAIYETAGFEDIQPEQWENMFLTNTRGPYLTVKEAAPHLRAKRGRVINIGSLGGLRPWTTHAHYCSAKAALVMLTQIMAKALAPEVAVNCVAPGMISLAQAEPTGWLKDIADRTPMKRAGRAEDVVETVLFLAQATHFLTGQIIAVDGGLGLNTF
jgi:NAD(P)-dependent dehydrogenase (short-subunit alcohol dehydrogenase family)